MPPKPVEQLFEAIGATNQWFKAAKVPFIYVEGIAASIHGKPRFTQDMDILIILEDLQLDSLVTLAKIFAVVPRIANVIPFAKKSRVLLMRHLPSSTDVDDMMGPMPFEEKMVQYAVLVQMSGRSIRVPRPKDLIIMKIISGRPNDIEDVRNILDVHPKIQRSKLRKTIIELGKVMDDSQMATVFDSIT